MRYAPPLLLLCLVIFAFFAPYIFLRQAQFRDFGGWQILLRVLVALPLLLSGIVLHFFQTAASVSIIPPGFPDPKMLVYISGILEVAGAVALFIPRLRRLSGFLLALMMVAVFPANIYAAGKTIGPMTMPGVPVRLAMQVVFIAMILFASFGVPAGSKPVRPG